MASTSTESGTAARFAYRNRHEARFDYTKFIELIDFRGGPTAFADCHHELIQFISRTAAPGSKLETWEVGNRGSAVYTHSEGRRRKLVLMPRGHLKSTLASVGYVLWRIYQNPNIRVFVGTGLYNLAKAFIREIRAYLEDPELQKYVWNNRPHYQGPLIPKMDRAGRKRRGRPTDEDIETEAEDKKVLWREDAIQVLRPEILKEPTVMAGSVGTILTGNHVDLVIFDDVVTFDNASTPGKIDRVFSWIRDVESILDPFHEATGLGDEAIVTGTRYNLLDYYGFLLSNLDDLSYDVHTRNLYRDGVSPEGGYLWPERYNETVEKRLRLTLGAKRFASQYLNSIIADEEVVLDFEEVQFLHPDSVRVHPGSVQIKLPGEVTWRTIRPFLAVDPAISQKTTADNTAIGVGGYDEEKNFYLLDLKIGKMLPNEIVESVFAMCSKWELKAATIEAVGFQAALIYSLKDGFTKHYPIVIGKYIPQGDKKSRIATILQPILSNHKFYMMTWMKSLTVLQNEFAFFPAETVTDDALDVTHIIATIAVPGQQPRSKNRQQRQQRLVNNMYGGYR